MAFVVIIVIAAQWGASVQTKKKKKCKFQSEFTLLKIGQEHFSNNVYIYNTDISQRSLGTWHRTLKGKRILQGCHTHGEVRGHLISHEECVSDGSRHLPRSPDLMQLDTHIHTELHTHTNTDFSLNQMVKTLSRSKLKSSLFGKITRNKSLTVTSFLIIFSPLKSPFYKLT